MKIKIGKILTFTALGILVVLIGLLGCIEYKTFQFNNTPTYRTNQKKYVKPYITEVFILGTTHRPKNNLNIDSLYNALEIIKPDVVLFEYDSTGFDNEMNLKRRSCYVFPSLLSNFQENEGSASKKYTNFNSNAIIRPYEWNLRSKWNKEKGILKTPDRVFETIEKLSNSKKLSKENQNIVREFYRLNDKLNKYSDSSIFLINTKQQDSISKMRSYFYYHKVKEFIDQNIELAEYREFWTNYEQYWDLRNKAMVRNICEYIKLYPQKRIVVLNGYFHRYYLIQELEPRQQILGFELVDINDVK